MNIRSLFLAILMAAMLTPSMVCATDMPAKDMAKKDMPPCHQDMADDLMFFKDCMNLELSPASFVPDVPVPGLQVAFILSPDDYLFQAGHTSALIHNKSPPLRLSDGRTTILKTQRFLN